MTAMVAATACLIFQCCSADDPFDDSMSNSTTWTSVTASTSLSGSIMGGFPGSGGRQ